MANRKGDGSVKVMRLNEPGGELLDAKYYCKVDNRKKLDVVIKLTASTHLSRSNIPQRYVILMDVSGSMNDKVKGDNRSLLQRIKVFGNLFVETLSEDTYVAIVTFSNVGEIVFPMTKMDQKGRRSAKDAIDALKTVGSTNISDGLFESLKAIERSSSGAPSRDCIILFTDGQANEGITQANILVSEYKSRVKRIRRSNEIPVSALTIGDNQPFFLNQVASGLGSDSFYWLNEDGDFEADMLLPMLIRELPSISDVRLELSCQNDVTFLADDVYQPCLQEEENKQASRTYFIHMIPSSMERNIYLSLKVPDKMREIDGKIFLEVWKSFLDGNMTEHRSTDYLELKLTSMREALYEAYSIPENEFDELSYLEGLELGPEAIDYLEKTSSYTTRNNQTLSSWEDAQESMVCVLGQQCRLETISAIEASAELVNRGQEAEAKESCGQALSKIQKIEKITEDVLGRNNVHCKQMQDSVKENFQGKLEFLTKDMSHYNPGRLTAMASSFSTEMPTATGVFEPKEKQPFMPSTVEKMHENIKQIVNKITLRARGYEDESDQETISETPPIESPPEKRVVYVFKSGLGGEEEFDPDSLFLASILPDLQMLDPQKKMELKMDILQLIHSSVYLKSN